MKKRRTIEVTVTMSVAPGVTKAEAKRELRTRVNDGCAHHYFIEDKAVRVRKVA